MAEPISRQVVQVADWPGLQTNGGPMAGGGQPGGAEVQENLRVNTPGELAARSGYHKVQFDEEG